MSLEKELNWYAVYTHSRAEKKVHERLSKSGFESFLPLITTYRQWSDRKKKVVVPLINSYVFVKTDSKNFNTILSVSGVYNILKHLGKPAIVKDLEIDNLKILANNNDAIQVVDLENVKIGDDIEVVKGPFKGLIAKCINDSGKHRVIVEVEALGNFVEVTIPLSHIREFVKK